MSRRARPGVSTGVIAACAFAVVVSPGVGLHDAGELGTAAQVLGVPHPTGFPLDMLLLRAATYLPLGSLAFRQNLWIACVSAAALGLIAALGFEVWGRSRERDTPGRSPVIATWAGVACALAFGTWETFLGTGLFVEVYSTALALGLLGAWVFARQGVRAGPTLGLLVGLSTGAHVTAGLFLSPLWLYCLVRRARDGRPGARVAPVVAALVTVAFGALLIAYLPLAARRGPPLDWGDPRTLERLWEHLTADRIRRSYAAKMFVESGKETAALFSQLSELWPLLPAAALGAILGLRRRATAVATTVVLAALALDLTYASFVNPMGIVDRQDGHFSGAWLTLLAAGGVVGLASLGKLGRVAAGALAALTLGAALVFVAPRSLHAVQTGWGPGELYGSGGPLVALPPRAVALCSSDNQCAAGFFALHAEGMRPDLGFAPAQHLWEPTIRAALTPPPSGASLHLDVRPATNDARGALVRATERELLRWEGRWRPVLWDDPPALGPAPPAGSPQAQGLPSLPAGPSAWPPWATFRDPVPTSRAIATLDGAYAAREDDATYPEVAVAWSRAYGAVGKRAFARGDAAGAVAAFERSVARAPDRPIGWTNLVRYLAAAGRLDDARRALGAAARAGVHDSALDALRRELDAARAPDERDQAAPAATPN